MIERVLDSTLEMCILEIEGIISKAWYAWV